MAIYRRTIQNDDRLSLDESGIDIPGVRVMVRHGVPMVPVYEENLTPREYLRFAEEESEDVKTIRFIPPKIGSFGFGKFHIDYSDPVFRPLNAQKRAALAKY